MKKIIYYFSGTGNSMRAAYRIAETLGDTEIVSMRCNPADVPADDADIIGFVFPVYHWTMPKAVVRFIKGLNINTNAYIFGVSTLIYINCHSLEVLNDLIAKKGARLSYATTLASVGSSLTNYSPMPNPVRQVPKSEKALTKISEEIQQQKVRKYPKANLLTRTIYPTRVKYIDMLYEVDRGFTVSDKCTGCGVCTKVCSCSNIALTDGKPAFKHQCNFCTSCFVYCPARAINYEVTAEIKAKYPFFEFSLTEDKERYHNPYISVSDISTNQRYVD